MTGPGGSTYSSGSGGRDPRNVKRLRVSLKSSKRTGSYKASWTIKAVDGHTQRGSFTLQSQVRFLLASAAAFLALATPAAAHIQVRPTLVAPGDPVLFEVLVPGERDAKTVEVTLQVPKDVLPFSFQDPPGWERTNEEAADGSIAAIRWRGEQAEDGFSRFAFLASTPEEEGEIQWKALQTYDDGHVSRWIGAADSENPAAVTTVSASAPRQNAGGEGAEEAAAEGEGAATPTPSRPSAAPASAPVEEDDSPLPLILGIVAVVLSAAALLVALRPRKTTAV